jgi:outer membrane protein W
MKKLMIILAICLTSGTVMAQKNTSNFFGVSWEVAFPNGDFVSDPSFLGGKVEYRHFFSDKIAAGVTLAWSNFDEYVNKKTYENADQTQAITTDMERFVFSMPITADVYYNFKAGDRFTPYVGLGVGAQYSKQEAYYNIYLSEESNWGFVARPQIGTLISLQPASPTRLILAAGYNYATNKNESFRIDNQQHFWISVGIGWKN